MSVRGVLATWLQAWDRVRSGLAGRLGESLGLLAARAGLAAVFWRSGRTKVVEGSWLQVSESTRFLFAEEYAGVPLPPDLAATLATWGEFILPLLLIAGLATPLAAAGVLAMTLVIQVFVYPAAWPTHLLWAALALLLVARGGGICSLDAWVRSLAGRGRFEEAAGGPMSWPKRIR